jgi:mono/diheme cytochrome c family protein
MKQTLKILTVLGVSLLMGCGDGEKKKEDPYGKKSSTEQTTETKVKSTVPPSERVDLTNKGVGPITSVTLAPEIDQTMVAHGKDVYEKMCTACHKADKKYIGPSPTGILERRTPEWVMNMILNPEVMIQKDPLAKELLMEFNGAPMANQNITEKEARAILEYFRTLK